MQLMQLSIGPIARYQLAKTARVASCRVRNATGGSNPFAVSGYYEFHGDGTLNGADTVSRNGIIIPRTYTGTYQVNSDGTGTLTLDMSPTFQPVGNFIIVDNGRAIEIIFAVPGNLNTFTQRKQHDLDDR